MTVWLAITVALVAATLSVSGGLAYILISLSRTAPLLGTRLGQVEFDVIRVSSRPRRSARRHGHRQLRSPAAVLPT